MTRPALFVGAAALGAFALSAAAQSSSVDVRAAMQDGVNPAMLAIWDVGNNAMNDTGGIDPALMDADKWANVAASAEQLAAVGRSLEAGQSFVAGAPDNREVAEGEIAMETVQGYLTADPETFRLLAGQFADHADKIAAAAKARDAATAGELINQMDAVCESCHLQYWYPEQ